MSEKFCQPKRRIYCKNNVVGVPLKKNTHPIYSGAFLLTMTGLLCRFIGFYYKIFLSRMIGPKELGLYQLSMPLLGVGIAFANSGIHTSISKFVAGVSAHNKEKARAYLRIGLLLSLGLGLLFSIPCFIFANFIATHIFCEPSIAILLKILSLCIPLECIHGCINGYYYGLQKASIPSGGQCVEQFVRVATVFGIYYIVENSSLTFTKTHAIIGLLAGGIAATLYYLTALSFEKIKAPSIPSSIRLTKDIVKMAYPITTTRLTLTFLNSFENIMIPVRLAKFGMSSTQALSIYGIYSGMAIPMVFFPTVVSNSVAVMLLPSISRAKAEGRDKYIEHTISIGFFLCMILGFACSFFFYFWGGFIGNTIFNNEVAGIYIRTLGWLCPFLFLGVTMNSILNGLGQTKTTFLISMLGASLRLITIMIGIHRFGFRAFLLGVLISQIASSFAAYICLMKNCIKKGVFKVF